MALSTLLLGVLIGILSAILYFIHRNINYWKSRGVVYEEPHLIYGNMPGFRRDRNFHQTFDAYYKRMKGKAPFAGFYFLHRPVAFILDLDLAKHILIKDFSNFVDRGVFYNERDDPLSAHLFALDGDKWKQLRQKLSSTFTSGKMKFMYPTLFKVAEEFVGLMGDLVQKESVLEIKDLLSRFTTDVIGTCAFGIECNSLRDPNVEFRKWGTKIFSDVRHGNLIFGFMQSFPRLARRLRLCVTQHGVDDFFMRIVHETVALREKHNIKRNDFMDLLIELKNKKSVTLENGEVLTGLTMNELAAQAFVFFAAGFETSSSTMSFALYELAYHQDVQDRLRQEINDVLAEHDHKFTYECIKDLRYCDQVIAETLRLYTTLPHLDRKALSDYTVPGHPNLVIEKGTSVMIPAAAYHRDPELYPEPKQFNPDRFSPEMVANRNSVEWLPFGDGPRNCIGMRFGQMQSRVGLALLVKDFKFTVCEKTQRPLKYNPKSFVLSTLGGIYLRVERI